MEELPEVGMYRQLAENKALIEDQPEETRLLLFNQAGQIWKALRSDKAYFRFHLPASVNHPLSENSIQSRQVPGYKQTQHVLRTPFLTNAGSQRSTTAFIQRLEKLETSPDPALRDGARLVRYATARHIVFNELDEGTPDDPTDKFYKPEWIFIEGGALLVSSVEEGRECLRKTEEYVHTLRQACAIANYIQADAVFQEKWNGMSSQLTHQGRELANYMVLKLIQEIRERSARQELNRGFTLSVPYFDDQELALRMHDFEVIPKSRILFEPAFVVEAAREQQDIITQDHHLSPPTQKDLLANLRMIEKSFGYNQQFHPLGMLFYSKSLDKVSSRVENILPDHRGSRKKT